MAQKAKCLTRSPEEKEQLAETVRMKNVRRNIKIRCLGGKCTGKSYRGIGIYRKWSLFSNISKFVFFRD